MVILEFLQTYYNLNPLKKVEDKILEKVDITSLQFKNSNTKLYFDKQFSEIVNGSSQFVDFIKVGVISDDYNIAKNYLNELLTLSSSLLLVKR